MGFFSSLTHEKFRKNFFVFLFLSSTFPLLLLIFIIYQHVIPVIMPDQINDLRVTFTYGVLVMLLPSFLSFALGSKWISSIETISEDIKSKSVQIIGEKEELNVENEFENIQQNFNVLYDEFQIKIDELNKISEKLIDSNNKFKKLALSDELTSLYNRRSFDLRLIEETSRADRYKEELSLIMIDLDDFKRVNDSLGHAIGDQLLIEVSRRLANLLREEDTAARLGGDEFVAVLVGFDDTPAARFGPVPLTTIRHPIKEYARIAVEMLQSQIQQRSISVTEPKVLDCELVVRGSTDPHWRRELNTCER